MTGTWDIPDLSISDEVGPAGEPGMIQADGGFRLRFKVLQGNFFDFFYVGSIDPTGQRLDGALTDTGFSDPSLTMTKNWWSVSAPNATSWRYEPAHAARRRSTRATGNPTTLV